MESREVSKLFTVLDTSPEGREDGVPGSYSRDVSRAKLAVMLDCALTDGEGVPLRIYPRPKSPQWPEGYNRWPTGAVIAWYGGHTVHVMRAAYYPNPDGSYGANMGRDISVWNTGDQSHDEATIQEVRESIERHIADCYFP